ncbi:agmatine deiminase family protein [Plebeiibacterium marinum]|uniref:Agmatine deiminase family protein n=1 Tax=Plebeiibacterium marinum TaxID=2992111 RepID=A0AAE3SKM4_9BACT|nr:agmatine deiminase family protein [Plebeiobacterium marinum]MCW3806663.1 agmatine deiminase family protein [Plebeiobacterium marinum]
MKEVRFPAEWEPQSFIQFTFPHKNSDWAYMYDEVVNCFVNIIEATAGFEPVLVVCHSISEVSAFFRNNTKYPIYYVEIESNDTWARDHGAITVFKDGEPELLDFTFNGWGQKFEAGLDNCISEKMAGGVLSPNKVKSFDFVLEGGAIESDGNGTLLTTSECLLSEFRNPTYTKEEIESFLMEVFGLRKVLWLDHGFLAGDDTDSHIDTLARVCSKNTLAYVKCDNESDEHFEALKLMEEQLKSFSNADGELYNLVALPWPDACYDDMGMRIPATYANFLIVNGGVLVPVYNVPQDQEALEVIQRIFPDRKVVGLNCRPLIDQHGSLHCITMQYPAGVNIIQ